MSWGEGSMNWAELRDLVDALPEDSATKSAEAGDTEGRRWNSATFLAAAQYNVLLMLVRILWTAHLKGQPPEMQPVQSPRLEAHDADDEAETEAKRRSEEYLNSFSPGAAQSDQAEIELWQSRIRELETAQ
ncbi:hypothetical protein O3Q52_01630 [Streptomyces sp. ActVer]|uniref:hypothetical protein n=1 Tax=Streptomyces sp. ActVer TaxID=3014558 RepID=UPI0022B3C760|nr:hypothetical protein [Streptomyces sp. ActVer]MCZ4506928.1 hypothetical protein [Streptomyces sp. ActVer]